jgi:hypothetical protein
MDNKPGNLATSVGLPGIDAREIFEASMRLLGWKDVALKNRTPEGYSDQRLNWAWIAFMVARRATVIEVAHWYKEKGWLLDEDDIPAAIKALSTP